MPCGSLPNKTYYANNLIIYHLNHTHVTNSAQKRQLNEVIMPKIEISLGDKLFSFKSHDDWIDNASMLYSKCGVERGKYITIDSIGRVCIKGLEFNRAKNEGTYPITVYKILV